MWPAGAEHPMGMGTGTGHGPAASSPSPSPRQDTTTLPAAAAQQSSAWQSPVPYLFGGLAAMLGLIALSLLALACSYWKLSGGLLAAGEGEPHDDDPERQAGGRTGDGGKATAGGKAGPAGDRWPEHVVVIMAGDEMPTFLATPASGRGLDDARDDVGGGGGFVDGDEGRCVECGARSWPAARTADEEPSRSEQGGGSSDSLNSER